MFQRRFLTVLNEEIGSLASQHRHAVPNREHAVLANVSVRQRKGEQVRELKEKYSGVLTVKYKILCNLSEWRMWKTFKHVSIQVVFFNIDTYSYVRVDLWL